jgi:hypothetical protein
VALDPVEELAAQALVLALGLTGPPWKPSSDRPAPPCAATCGVEPFCAACPFDALPFRWWTGCRSTALLGGFLDSVVTVVTPVTLVTPPAFRSSASSACL